MISQIEFLKRIQPFAPSKGLNEDYHFKENIKNSDNVITHFLKRYEELTNKYGTISFSITDFFDESQNITGYKPSDLPEYFTITWKYRF